MTTPFRTAAETPSSQSSLLQEQTDDCDWLMADWLISWLAGATDWQCRSVSLCWIHDITFRAAFLWMSSQFKPRTWPEIIRLLSEVYSYLTDPGSASWTQSETRSRKEGVCQLSMAQPVATLWEIAFLLLPPPSGLAQITSRSPSAAHGAVLRVISCHWCDQEKYGSVLWQGRDGVWGGKLRRLLFSAEIWLLTKLSLPALQQCAEIQARGDEMKRTRHLMRLLLIHTS